MKKILFILFCIPWGLYAQMLLPEQQQLLDSLSEIIADKLAEEIYNNIKIPEEYKNKTTVNIKLNSVSNQNDELTIFSNTFTVNLANHLNNAFDKIAKIGRFETFNIYSEGLEPLDFDYEINAIYYFTNSGLTLSSIEVLPDRNKVAARNYKKTTLKQISVKANIKPLTNLDKPSKKALFYDFINFKTKADLIKSFYLSARKENLLPSYDSVFAQNIWNVKTNIQYTINIQLKDSAYVYLFYYDPKENFINLVYPYGAYYNKKLGTAEHKYGPFLFNLTGSDSRFCYFFIIATYNKIPYENLFDRKEKVGRGLVYFLDSQEKVEFLIKTLKKYSKKTQTLKQIIIINTE